jgi:hypothetical protein
MSTSEHTFKVKGEADVGQAQQALGGMRGGVVALNQALELGAKAWQAFNGVVVDNARLALDQARIFRTLEVRVERLGISYSDVRGELSGFFADMQRVTRFGDDALAQTMATLATATAALNPSIDQLQQWTSDVADFAEATGMSLEGASRIVARAVSGDVAALGRALPAYKDAIREIALIPDASERGREALALLREEFGGAAQAIAPLDLALARVTNGMGDWREAIGDVLVQSPEIATAMDALANQVDALALAFTQGADGPSAMGQAIIAMTEAGISTISTLGTTVVTTFTRIRQAQLAVEAGSATLQGSVFSAAAGDLRGGRLATMDVAAALNRANRQTDLARLREIQRSIQPRGGARSGSGLSGPPQMTSEQSAFVDQLVRELEATADQQNTVADSVVTQMLALEGDMDRARRDAAAGAEAARERLAQLMADAANTSAGGGGGGQGETVDDTGTGGEFAIGRKGDVPAALAEKAERDKLDAAQQFRLAVEDSLRAAAERELEILRNKKEIEYEIEQSANARLLAEQEETAQRREEIGKRVGAAVGQLTADLASGQEKAGVVIKRFIGQQLVAEGQANLLKAAAMFFIPGQRLRAAGLTAASFAMIYGGAKLGAAANAQAARGGTGDDEDPTLDSTGIRDNASRDLAAVARQNVLVVDTVITEDARTMRRLQTMQARELSRGGALVNV